VFQTYWATNRGAEAGATSYHLLDLTVYGRQELWEDSPEGWPQPYAMTGEQFRTGERYAGCKLTGCWACPWLGSLHTPGFDV
jgi:predicted dithiol-disulfide oxidoreductase (DUF899 family)